MRNVITRGFGIDDKIEIDFQTLGIGKDSKILLCSDGLSDMVQDARIEQMINILPSYKLCDELLREANANGGRDNISVILLNVQFSKVRRLKISN